MLIFHKKDKGCNFPMFCTLITCLYLSKMSVKGYLVKWYHFKSIFQMYKWLKMEISEKSDPEGALYILGHKFVH